MPSGTRIITEPRAYRLLRERAEQQQRRVRGYALAIDFLDGDAHDARPIEKHAPVLFPETVSIEDKERRRFGFVEFMGEGTPPTGLLRSVGDAFFADRRTAEFVWQAVIEKIENDAAHINRVTS